MGYEVRTTPVFDQWLKELKDRRAVRAIMLRLARAEAGNLGDIKPVGGGVREMRLFVGKGYRLYFSIQGETLLLLLNGGIKSNKKQQQLDIQRAIRIVEEIED
ncbi:type II toxin-antitoxin system RelE/ParE family toxin [Thiolapillus brandeum]|nr:type II toxin-antitoxin system RelE/ParE family toxin [Thiolapillus brandeum]